MQETHGGDKDDAFPLPFQGESGLLHIDYGGDDHHDLQNLLKAVSHKVHRKQLVKPSD